MTDKLREIAEGRRAAVAIAENGGPEESARAKVRIGDWDRLRAKVIGDQLPPMRVCRGCAEGCEGCGYAVQHGAHVGQGT